MTENEPLKALYEESVRFEEHGIRLLPGESLCIRGAYIKNCFKDPIYVSDENWVDLSEALHALAQNLGSDLARP